MSAKRKWDAVRQDYTVGGDCLRGRGRGENTSTSDLLPCHQHCGMQRLRVAILIVSGYTTHLGRNRIITFHVGVEPE